MKRLFSILILSAFPSITFAAALSSSADIIRAIRDETKPIAFSLVASQGMTTVNVRGQKEGAGIKKGWVSIKTEWKEGGEWMNTEADLRVKGGSAYVRLASVTGTSAAPHYASFKAMEGTWYSLDAVMVRHWFTVPLASVDTPVVLERFKGGYSYSFSSVSSMTSTVPWLIVPMSGEVIRAKIDTNLFNDFQFANIEIGSLFRSTLQRQFHAVYIETPQQVTVLPVGALKDFFFGVSGEMKSIDIQKAVSSSASGTQSSASNATSQSVTKARVTVVPRADTSSEHIALHLHGPNGKDIKVSARVGSGHTTWNSLALFNADFRNGRGILYQYSQPTDVRFSGKGAFSGLEVLFFDQAGRFISSASLPRCGRLECETYGPDQPASFALEVGTGFLRRTKINSLWRLSLDWIAEPVRTGTHQQFGRTSVRVIEQRLQIPAPVSRSQVEAFEIDQSFRILAQVTASKFRSADILAASKKAPDDTSAYRLYSLLFDAISRNDLRYGFIVVPTDTHDTFQLVLDNYTFAPFDVLDVNKSGRVDTEEAPAVRGSSYMYPLLTLALSGYVFDTSIAGELAIFVPVKDSNGTTIAILALVK